MSMMEKNLLTKIKNILVKIRNRERISQITRSVLKNIISCGVDPLCLPGSAECGIAYCCCIRGIGISSETERETPRCILLLRGGGGFKIVSLTVVIF